MGAVQGVRNLGHTVMYEKTGTVGTRHIFAGSQRIAEVKGGVVSFFHNDHLGSPRAVTSSTGALTAAIATNPFGEPHAGSAQTSYGFTGKDLDSTGLYYFAARYYDASVGRFTSQDPHWNHHNMIYGDDPNNKFPLISAITQSTNLYVYCGNNPLGYVDPDGQIFTVATGIIGAVVGGVVGAIHAKHTGGNVLKGGLTSAAIGGAIGLTGGAGVAYLTTGSALASKTLVGIGLAKLFSGTGPYSVAGPIRVIGSFPQYLHRAGELGAKAFSMPPDIWNRMSEAQRWLANKTFLDRGIKEGSQFLLESSKEVYQYGKYLQMEIQYLLQNGYHFVENGTKLIKK